MSDLPLLCALVSSSDSHAPALWSSEQIIDLRPLWDDFSRESRLKEPWGKMELRK